MLDLIFTYILDRVTPVLSEYLLSTLDTSMK